jgi:predicted site-specific integrase-resolvase
MKHQAKNGSGVMEDTIVLTLEAAQIIGRGPGVVHWYNKQGKLPAMRTTKGVRLFKRSDVEKLAKELRAKEHRREATQSNDQSE